MWPKEFPPPPPCGDLFVGDDKILIAQIFDSFKYQEFLRMGNLSKLWVGHILQGVLKAIQSIMNTR